MIERLPSGDSGTQLVPARGVELDPTLGYGTLPDGGSRPAAGAGTAQIRRLISALFRYKWLVIAIVILGTVGAVAATRFIQPEYRAAGTIYIQQNGKGGAIQAAELLSNDSWLQLIRSYAVLDPVIRKTRVYLDVPPEDSAAFGGFDIADQVVPGSYRLRTDASGRRYTLSRQADGGEIERGSVGDSVGGRLGFLWAPGASALGKSRDIAFEIHSLRDASTVLQNQLRTVMPGREGTFLAVSLTGPEPKRTATVLNAILDEFVALAERLKKENLVKVTKDLAAQLRSADSSARDAQTALESYRVQTITEPREDQFPLPSGLAQTQPSVMTNYFQMRMNLNAVQRDRKAIEDVLRQGREAGAVPIDAFHTIAAVKGAPGLVGVLGEVAKADAELRAARLRYTDEHKIVKDLLAQLDELRNKTVPVYAERLVAQLKEQEAQLQHDIDGESRELRQIPVRTLTEEKLRREATSAVALSQMLQNRLTDQRLAELSATADVSILDRAVPPSRPSSNTAPRIILMGVAGSIGFALVLAILLDRLDRRFRYPEQATQDLGLTILGAVPVIRRDDRGLMPPTDTAQIVESFRSIRLNLTHSFQPDEPIVVSLTSPGPGDGKSLISANLAISFAEAGYETLLIDGDTRRGEQFRTFQVERRPGLLDYLDTALPAEEVLYPTSHERLTVLPSGSRMTRGPELLGSSRMTDLMAFLRTRYQAIIVDNPPLGAGVDPFVLATVTGAVCVVLRAGETDRQLAEAKLELMERLPTRLIGAILNHIDVGHGSYKYYAYEYSSEPEPIVESPIDRPAAPLTSGRS